MKYEEIIFNPTETEFIDTVAKDFNLNRHDMILLALLFVDGMRENYND